MTAAACAAHYQPCLPRKTESPGVRRVEHAGASLSMRASPQRPSLPLPSGSQTRPRRRDAALKRGGSDSRCRTACIGRAPRESGPAACGRHPPRSLSPWAEPPTAFPAAQCTPSPGADHVYPIAFGYSISLSYTAT